MAINPGNSLNSGASIYVASGFPIIMEKTMLAFNEVQFGFVPHAGSTYFLSRLPDEFGTFLSLTGMPFSGKDAIRLDLADNYVDTLRDLEAGLHNAVFARDPSSLPTAN